MAIALHPGVTARSERSGAKRFGTSRSEVLSGVYAEHYDRLMGYFVRRTRDRLLAEDLTQDTILRFVRSCDSFDVSRPAWPYLKATATNVLIDHLRRAERQVDMDVEQELEEEECLDPTPDYLMVLREMLGEALDLLPERQRIAVDLRYERGWSVPDAAEFLGVSAGTFGQLLFRARQTMKDYLDSVGSGVHGVALPALLALRWRWRTWTAKGRAMAQTPVTAMSMEAVASVVVAATFGVGAAFSSGGLQTASPELVAAPMAPAASAITEETLPRPIAQFDKVDRQVSADAWSDGASPVSSETPKAADTARTIAAPMNPAGAGGHLAIDDDRNDDFVISHEINSRTGLPITSEGDVVSFGCESLLGVLCSDEE